MVRLQLTRLVAGLPKTRRMFFRLRKLCKNHAVQMCIKQCRQYRTGSEYCPQLPLNVISSHRYEAVDELGTFDIEEPAAGNFTEFY